MAKSRREILVAIQSPSAPSTLLLEKAAVLARAQHAELHLAHVIAQPYSTVAPERMTIPSKQCVPSSSAAASNWRA
jgi:hypothetical protein